jgi:ATP-binding cassette subfamily F protein 3
MRISLAKVLVSEPNLLLLDEPTNFLDILSIRWLIGYLNQWKNELIVISHNRYFMDSVTSVILGVHRQTLKKVKGSTKTYYSHIAKEEEIYEKLRINQAKKSKQMDDFISRFRAKARHASLVQSRKKAMEKVEPRDKLEAISSLSFSFNYAPERAKNLMETNNLSFSYSGFQPYLIDQFDLTVSSRDRICVIGKNGQGKSTLLRLLAGKLTPQTGEIKMFPQTRFSYFEQAQTEYMDDNLTVEEQIITSQEDGDRQKARDICGSMMFSDDDALKPTSVLSGGEKSRVLLGKMLVTSANLILMDEPTQHLDIESCEALMNAILSFPGAVIIVTHNERILRKVATRLIVFQRDRIFHFHDEYNRFLEQIGWEDETFMLNQDQINKIQTKTEKATLRKEMRQRRAEFIERRSQTLKPYLEQIQELEQAIGSLEIRIEGENKLLVTACHVQDANDITRLSKSIQQAQENLEKLYEFLLEQEEMYEKEKARFQYEESELLHRQG